MYDLYFWPTPNGWKITIMLEELDLDYNVKYVNIGKGEQFEPSFLQMNPNHRMPVLVDNNPADSLAPLSIFESGAILTYLADKHSRFLPQEGRERYKVLEWLFWQMGGLGPMAGQASHFVNYAPKQGNEYSYTRYTDEFNRLLGVMERILNEREFLAGDYSIADMACFPWVTPYKRFGSDLDDFPMVRKWFDKLKHRPAVRKGIEVGQELRKQAQSEDSKKVLFGQRADITKK